MCASSGRGRPAALGASFIASLALLGVVWQRGPVVFQVGGWPPPFGITLVGDLLAATMVVMAQGVLVTGMIYALGCRDKCATYPAFFPLFLTLTVGLTGDVSDRRHLQSVRFR